MSDFFIPKKTVQDHWYREPWMLLVLGGPLIVIIAAIFTFYLAWQGADNVLTKDYYKQGLNIDKDIQRDAKAAEYKMLANLKIENSTGMAQLHLEGGIGLPATIALTITSSARGSEYETLKKITLNQVKSGYYEGTLQTLIQSDSVNHKLWHVKMEGPDWRLTADWRDPLHTPLQLKP